MIESNNLIFITEPYRQQTFGGTCPLSLNSLKHRLRYTKKTFKLKIRINKTSCGFLLFFYYLMTVTQNIKQDFTILLINGLHTSSNVPMVQIS